MVEFTAEGHALGEPADRKVEIGERVGDDVGRRLTFDGRAQREDDFAGLTGARAGAELVAPARSNAQRSPTSATTQIAPASRV